jgi:hypothetical protein
MLLKSALIAALWLAAPAQAAIKLDFEGLDGFDAIGQFYNGGQGTRLNLGATGRSGVEFSSTVLATVDSDACSINLPTRCAGNFANNPSGSTVMAPTDFTTTFLNIAAGFTDQVSAWHVTGSAASISVWSGLNANTVTNTRIGFIDLPQGQLSSTCVGNPNGAPFCHWSQLVLNFSGVARSVSFGFAQYDDVVLGLPGNTGAVPNRPVGPCSSPALA